MIITSPLPTLPQVMAAADGAMSTPQRLSTIAESYFGGEVPAEVSALIHDYRALRLRPTRFAQDLGEILQGDGATLSNPVYVAMDLAARAHHVRGPGGEINGKRLKQASITCADALRSQWKRQGFQGVQHPQPMDLAKSIVKHSSEAEEAQQWVQQKRLEDVDDVICALTEIIPPDAHDSVKAELIQDDAGLTLKVQLVLDVARNKLLGRGSYTNCLNGVMREVYNTLLNSDFPDVKSLARLEALRVAFRQRNIEYMVQHSPQDVIGFSNDNIKHALNGLAVGMDGELHFDNLPDVILAQIFAMQVRGYDAHRVESIKNFRTEACAFLEKFMMVEDQQAELDGVDLNQLYVFMRRCLPANLQLNPTRSNSGFDVPPRDESVLKAYDAVGESGEENDWKSNQL